MPDFDVVIIGAGVAGGALGTRLARDGFGVLILERTLVHVDRIRGESMPPWGVQEAVRLGVLDDLLAAGGHYNTKLTRFDPGIPIEVARANSIDLSAMIPGVKGVMAFGHPRLCDTLNRAAQAAGATLLRGVSRIRVEPGQSPTVSFEHQGKHSVVRPRLVVGADGRGSTVAKQIGAQVQTEPVHHLIAGLLVDGFDAWPEDVFAIGTDQRTCNLVFPQGNGRVRVYTCYPAEDRGRFSGVSAAENFLVAFGATSMPCAEHIASAKIAGPCQGYPNADTWIHQPTAPGVVLIGDAAGHNDPTIGQGLSITMCDARTIAETLAGTTTWDDPKLFMSYVVERRERMQRLRHVAHVMAILRCEFDDGADRRRADLPNRAARDPNIAALLMAPLKGPYSPPDQSFGEATVKGLLGEQWSMTVDGLLQQTTSQ
jgi:2-polyprenyl-6-methoxyphenol hydroxylase-like FAD-dependent oxidoreductase